MFIIKWHKYMNCKFMGEKKNIAITFGITGNYAFALGNVLIGLKKHSPNLNADIIVFEQGVSEKDKILLNSIIPCNFIQYKFPDDIFLTNDTLKRFSELTFSRFECFKLLGQYKNVLWLDVDILIQKDVTELLNEKSTGISLLGGQKAGNDFSIEIKGLEREKESFNAGVMYIQDNLTSYQMQTNWCYQKTIEYAPYLISADQGIINLMIKENNIEVHRLHWNYNFNPACGGDTSKAFILHTYCPEKFWNYWDIKEWNQNNKQWVKMGGSEYTGKKYSWWDRKFRDVPNPLKRTRSFIKYICRGIL